MKHFITDHLLSNAVKASANINNPDLEDFSESHADEEHDPEEQHDFVVDVAALDELVVADSVVGLTRFLTCSNKSR